MEEIISMIKPAVIIFVVLMVLFAVLSFTAQIMSILESVSEKRAYDLIAQEEEKEIEYKKKKEEREKEIHREKLELIQKQKRVADLAEKKYEEEKREKEREDRKAAMQRNLYSRKEQKI